MGDPWHSSDVGLTAFTGYLWPKGGMWRDGTTWARQLETYWEQHSFNSTSQDLDGIYTALSLSTSGIGAVRTDPLSLAMLYRAESVDFVAYSSRAALAARAATPNGEPDRDPWGVGWLPYLSYLAGPQTGYANTVVLPIGAYVDIHPSWGSRVRTAGTPQWVADVAVDSSYNELCAVVHDDLARSVVSTSLLPTSERLADITGGKDSRLVLALMIEAGVTERFTFRTLGAPSSADAIVSADISSRFSLKHQLFTFGRMEEPAFDRRLRTHVFQTSGMYNAWNLKGALGLQWVPGVSGGAGETLRSFFGAYPPVSSPQELHATFASRCDRFALRRELVEVFESGGCTNEDLLDAFYLRARMRRWFGAGEELGQGFRFFPLYSLLGVRAAFALGPIRRRAEILHFEVMRSACDELARCPFANATWPAGALADLPDADSYRRPAQKATPGAPVQWQASRLTETEPSWRRTCSTSPPTRSSTSLTAAPWRNC